MQEPTPDTETIRRPIRSYVTRTGRTTVGQGKALLDLGPQFFLPYAPDTLKTEALHDLFKLTLGKKPEKIVLEIGFGMGEATAHIAQVLPDTGFIACEVHTPGVGALLMRIAAQKLGNIRIIQHDAVEVLNNMLPAQSLDGVHIFFPDPWHKKRHNKRRLIQTPLVTLLASRLKSGGYIHCATDWQPYAEQILEVMQVAPELANSSSHADGYSDKPSYRPLTKFENRGIKLGHGVWDTVFVKKS
jgi:tRNA (guanine-N7-)-methyltransferase